jgi:hypothetical protein
MEGETAELFRSVVRSLNWYIKMKLPYTQASLTNRKATKSTICDGIVGKHADFAYGTYFEYIGNRLTIEALNTHDLYFITHFDQLEQFHDSEDLIKTNEKVLKKDSARANDIPASLTEHMSKLNLKTTINIDNLTGNDDDVEEWFETFERIGSASGWNYEIQSIKLPNYLKETALLIWNSLSKADKVDYSKTKAAIINECTIPDMLEETFHSKRQKPTEGVIEYYFLLNKLARRCYPDMQTETFNKMILKKYINSVLPKYKKLLLVADPQTNDEAKKMAKRAELCEKQEEGHSLTNTVTKASSDKDDSYKRYSRPKNNQTYRMTDQRISPEPSQSPERRRSPARMRSPTPGKAPLFCVYCKKDNHDVDKCFKRIAFEKSVICRICDQKGHIARRCPKN